MNRQLLCCSVLSILVAGCSSVNNKQALGEFDYAETAEAKPLTIPANLSAPKQAQEFYVPSDVNKKGSIGKNIDVRAPSLVLPVASASRVETGQKNANVWFDQVLEDESIESFVVKAMKTQLSDDGVGIESIDSDNTVYESQWYNKETISGVWGFESIDTTESFRFKYELERKPHGRSVGLSVSLIDYMKTDSSGSRKTIDPIDQERAEIAMLNQIVSQVDFQYRKLKRDNQLLRSKQKLVSVGENLLGEDAYLVDMDLESLWSNMPIFFEDHGFSITDLDESKKIYYVDFVKPEVSLWDSIWGDEVPIVDVSNQKYQFVLAGLDASDEKTSVTIFDSAGNVVAEETLTRIFPVMEVGLSFRTAF